MTVNRLEALKALERLVRNGPRAFSGDIILVNELVKELLGGVVEGRADRKVYMREYMKGWRARQRDAD